MTTSNTAIAVILIIVSLCVIFFTENQNNAICPEYFVSKSEPDNTTELLKQENQRIILPTNMYINTENFNKLQDMVYDTIYNTVVKRAQQCGTIDQIDSIKVRPENQLTLTCLTSPEELQDLIITNITNLLIDYIYKNHQILLNEYYVASMLYTHLHLMDSLIYPLLMTKQYTLYGISYFTRIMLRNMISQNMKIHDILYTILSSHGIDTIRSSDDQK